MKRMFWLSLCAVLLAAGCKTAALRDDIRTDLNFSFSPITIWKSDELHLPYVTGAKVSVWLEDDANADMNDWRFESSAPEVLSVTTRDTGIGSMRAAVTAGAAGTAVLRALDVSGRIRYSFSIPVVAPDRAELAPHGPLLLHQSPAQAAVTDARILAGGSTTFHVRYFAGNRRLFGNGALRVAPSAGVLAEPRTTFLFENQEWLTITARRPGEQQVGLSAGTTALPALRVVAVDESALRRIVLSGEDEGGARRGDWLNITATGVDDAGQTVYGVDCDWVLEGVTQTTDGWPWDQAPSEVGDLYRYEYRGDLTKSLTASRGTHEATATLHAGLGYVSSTNTLGCSAGGDDIGALWGALLVLGAALLVARRKPRSDDGNDPR